VHWYFPVVAAGWPETGPYAVPLIRPSGEPTSRIRKKMAVYMMVSLAACNDRYWEGKQNPGIPGKASTAARLPIMDETTVQVCDATMLKRCRCPAQKRSATVTIKFRNKIG
jgi:hypothetical protein